MGNCFAAPIPLDEQPKCAACGMTGPVPWGKMAESQRAYWEQQLGRVFCKKCFVEKKTNRRRFQKERENYKKIKEELYPRSTKQITLKKIKSGEKWEGTASFYQEWRPSSFVAPLVELARKATGVVKHEGQPTGGPQKVQQPEQAPQPEHEQRAVQLESSLQGLCVAVTEESLSGSEQDDILEDFDLTPRACCNKGCTRAAAGKAGPSSEPSCTGCSGKQQKQLSLPAGVRDLQLKPREAAFGQGLSQRDDSANSEDWSPPGAKTQAGAFAERREQLGAIQEEGAASPRPSLAVVAK